MSEVARVFKINQNNMEPEDYEKVVEIGDKSLFVVETQQTLDLIAFLEAKTAIENGDIDSLLVYDGNVEDDPTEEVDMTGFRLGLLREQLEAMFKGDDVIPQDGGAIVNYGDFVVVAEGTEAVQTGSIEVVEVRTGKTVSFADGLDVFMPVLHAARASRSRMRV